MQRRQLLKWLLPLALLPAGVVATRKLLTSSSCHAPNLATLLARLKPFSDAELGKKTDTENNANDMKRFDALCEQDFDNSYRQLIAKDFAQGKIKKVDGWLLSQTEALTHRVVYQSALQTY